MVRPESARSALIWGGAVAVVEGWHQVASLTQSDKGFTARDFAARKDELFGELPRQPQF